MSESEAYDRFVRKHARRRRMFTLSVEYKNVDARLGVLLTQAVGRRPIGGGWYFVDGVTDRTWRFAKRTTAIIAGRRALRALRRIRGSGGKAMLYSAQRPYRIRLPAKKAVA